MTEPKPTPLITVKKTARNFRMKDCEFQMGESERPILETKAEGTKIDGTKVTAHSASGKSWWDAPLFSKFLVPLVVAIIAGLVLYLFIGV